MPAGETISGVCIAGEEGKKEEEEMEIGGGGETRRGTEGYTNTNIAAKTNTSKLKIGKKKDEDRKGEDEQMVGSGPWLW